MATPEEIIAKIDEYLEGKITEEEAARWAASELDKTELRGIRHHALQDLMLLTEFEFARTTREELERNKYVLSKYDWTEKELIGEDALPREAIWMAYEPGDRIVTVKILRKSPKELILTFQVRTWEGEILSSHETLIDVLEPCKELSLEDVKSLQCYLEKHQKDALPLLIREMGARCIDSMYPFLLKFYFWAYDPNLHFDYSIFVSSPHDVWKPPHPG